MRSVSQSASCARYGSPCLGYVDSIAHIHSKVKYYFSVFRKWFLTASRSVTSGNYTEVQAVRSNCTGRECRMRFCRCMTFEESKGGRGGALARCLPTWISYHTLSYLSTVIFCFFVHSLFAYLFAYLPCPMSHFCAVRH